jgi:hypothetical protein
MKTIGLMIAVFLLVMATSCQPEEDCKRCKIVESQNGVVVSESSPEEYCDTSLDSKENEAPVIIGDTKTEWKCN